MNNKLSKYCFRLSKSVLKNDAHKSNEYAVHLKYYIQKGGADPQQINNELSMLDKIIGIINNNQDIYNIDNMKKKISEKEDELKKANDKIKDLQNNLDDITNKLKTGDVSKDDAMLALTKEKDRIQKDLETTAKELSDTQLELEKLKSDNNGKINNLIKELNDLQDNIINLISDDEIKEMPADKKQAVEEVLKKLADKNKEIKN